MQSWCFLTEPSHTEQPAIFYPESILFIKNSFTMEKIDRGKAPPASVTWLDVLSWQREGKGTSIKLKHRSQHVVGRSKAGNSFLPSSPLATELATDLVLSLNCSHSVFNP